MANLLFSVTLLAILAVGHGRVVPISRDIADNNSTPIDSNNHAPELVRRDRDPTSFAWVHRLAAIGDSFTAGIGSGVQLGEVFHRTDDWLCSRYDYSYPYLINEMIGPAVDDFQFLACSGDRSEHIYEQVEKMDDDVDMVVMTAGGNDLCLASMIKKCVLQPYEGEATCQEVIDKAEENIDTILKPNLKQILKALNDKTNKDSIVVYNGYARFFNTEDEACAKDQKWNFARVNPKHWFKTPLKLSSKRRKRFNDLVISINKAIREVVEDVEDEVDYTIGFSNWDLWAIDGVKGQMCDPMSTGHYPDDEQPDLQFFKADTHIAVWHNDELKRRAEEFDSFSEEEFEEHNSRVDKRIYDSLLWKSPNPKHEARHKLDKRAPSPPECPGDKDIDPTLGLGLPDTFGKLFHPNELGHETIASFAVAKAMDLRAKVLGAEPETCEIVDEFKCWQKEGSKAYADPDRLDENYEDFCDDVEQPEHEVGWKYEKTYHKGTPDEHAFVLQLSDSVAEFDKDECKESMDRIIHSCDGDDSDNPMNWKFGGSWRRGEYTYEVNPKRDNRPWPVIKEPHGVCNGWWKASHSHYDMRGAGWSGYDHGQKTLLPNIKKCLGLGVTSWKFKYFDEPDEDGMEWKSGFDTPVFVNARCFENNKVARWAGGFTDGCGGSDP